MNRLIKNAITHNTKSNIKIKQTQTRQNIALIFFLHLGMVMLWRGFPSSCDWKAELKKPSPGPLCKIIKLYLEMQTSNFL